MRDDTIIAAALIAAASLIASAAKAADAPAANGSGSGFFDQRYTWPITIGKAENRVLSDDGKSYCYRRGDSLQIYGNSPTSLPDPKADDKPKTTTTPNYTRYRVTGSFPEPATFFGIPLGFDIGGETNKPDECNNTDTTTNHVTEGQIVNIPTQFIANNPQDWHGFAYGALAVPFKYQLTGKNDITGSGTAGPYIGYRFDRSGTIGFSTEFVAFVGAADISVSQTVNGKSATQNLFAISYGVGVIGFLSQSLQAGVVLGFDHVATSSSYQYNDKPWLALSLGYSFAK